MKNKRVAVFIANYAFGRSPTNINTIICLAKAGYEVDVFVYQGRGPEPYFQDNKIHIYNLSKNNITINDTVKNFSIYYISFEKFKNILKKILPDTFTYRLVQIKQSLLRKYTDIIPLGVIETSKRIIEKKHYNYFFGIEPEGLMWAGLVGGGDKVPLVYYSQELCLENDPRYQTSYYKILWRMEKEFHKKCVATIIQDEERGKILAKHNNVSIDNFIYVPVGIIGEPVRIKNKYFHQKFGIPTDKKITLNLGWIGSDRMSLEIAEISKELPEEWVMVFHGFGEKECIEKIKDITNKNSKLYLSFDLVDIEKIPELVSSCDAGLMFYKNFSENESNTGVSSGKIANYLHCGLPVIAIDFPSISNILNTYNCGICADNPDKIPFALKEIISNYDKMRENAFRCFEEKYEFSKYFNKVLEKMEEYKSE